MRSRRFFPINGNTFFFVGEDVVFFYHRKELFFIGKIVFVHRNELYFSREKLLQQQQKDEEEGVVRKINDFFIEYDCTSALLDYIGNK